MYCSATPLKDLIIKAGFQASLYHQVTAYDHVIAYSLITIVIVDMEVVINYLTARKLRNEKRHLDVMRHAIHACVCTIFYFVRPHLAFIVLSVSYFYHDVGISVILQSC